MFHREITELIQKVVEEKEIILEFPENEDFGDYSTNVAMVVAKKEGKNPQEVAKGFVEKLQKYEELSKIVSKIEVAGLGFINFWLAKSVLTSELEKVVKEGEKYGFSDIGSGETVVVEYSSPNIAKRFGIGHLRSTIIGQALYNLYKFLGYKVVGDNHIGDWGTQFGTLLYQIASKGLEPSKLTIDELEKLYIEFNAEAERNEKLWDEARAYFKRLEDGDAKTRETWKILVNTSMEEFDRIYKLLGVHIDNCYGESFYQNKMPAVIEEVRSKGLSKKSQGAEIVEFKDMPPAMLIKSDGTTIYFTRDLATIKFRISEWNPKLIIYEVGMDQILHFRQVFATAKLLGWNDERHYEHVAHGLIRFPHGKMSTRKGETVKLEDVLDEAVRRAYEITKSETINVKYASKTAIKTHTGPFKTNHIKGEAEARKIAGQVGIGAVKYFDLMHHPKTDIIFDWEKIFVLEGNSAPYLQYTVARANSILSKIPNSNDKVGYSFQIPNNSQNTNYQNLETGDWKLEINKEELTVLRSLVRFSDVIAFAAKNYSPNLLTNYLFDLAQKYNNFYNQHRIIGGENEEFRITLTAGTGQVLKNGLGILGIETPERM